MTNQPPEPYQPGIDPSHPRHDERYQMAQPYQQPPPPKKKHTVRNVLLVLAGLFILAMVGCVALIGGAANEAAKESDRSAPRTVAIGEAFTLGKHETLAGWKLVNEAGMISVTGTVKNTSDSTSTSFIHFKVISVQGEVLANIQCNSGDLEPGQTQTLNCIPDGNYPQYGRNVTVTAEATF